MIRIRNCLIPRLKKIPLQRLEKVIQALKDYRDKMFIYPYRVDWCIDGLERIIKNEK